ARSSAGPATPRMPSRRWKRHWRTGPARTRACAVSRWRWPTAGLGTRRRPGSGSTAASAGYGRWPMGLGPNPSASKPVAPGPRPPRRSGTRRDASYNGVMASRDARPLALSVAQVVPCTEAEGPGRRYALWFQGCPLRCPGCCNPEMLRSPGATPRPVAALLADITQARQAHGIEGVTLLGGEPLAHAAGAAALARGVRALGLSVMVFSGYTLDEARALPDP